MSSSKVRFKFLVTNYSYFDGYPPKFLESLKHFFVIFNLESSLVSSYFLFGMQKPATGELEGPYFCWVKVKPIEFKGPHPGGPKWGGIWWPFPCANGGGIFQPNGFFISYLCFHHGYYCLASST